jgi:hypothetical protein
MNKYDVHIPSCIENIEHSRNTELNEEDMACKQLQHFCQQESGISILSSNNEFYNCPNLWDAWQPPELILVYDRLSC